MLSSLKSSPLLPTRSFFVGLAIVMLALWMSFIPNWLTFVHAWRVELFASAFLAITLLFAYRSSEKFRLASSLSPDEIRFILLPMTAFILWSAASAIWATSWKSALHHTLIWCLYLIFYCIVRCLLNETGHYRKFVFVFAGSLVLCALPAVFGYASILIFGGGNTLGIRFSRFSEQVIVLLPLLIVGILRLKSKNFAIGVLVISTLWLLVYCSMSRAGTMLFVAAAFGSGIIVLANGRFRTYRLKYAIVLAVLIISPLALRSASFLATEDHTAMVSRSADPSSLTNSNEFRELMISLSLEMFSDRPIIGIGADNFGSQVNEYREAFASKNPEHPHLAHAEIGLPERAHNEYLQILAELGIIGFAIFAWFLIGIGLMAVRAFRDRKTRPPQALAAVLGLGLFLVAAAVTSYSFRLIQNGFVFFFVLAVASRLLLRRNRTTESRNSIVLPKASVKIIFASAVAACVLLFAYSSLRVTSVILTERAGRTEDLGEAIALYEIAASLDNENPFARNHHGMRLFGEERYSESIPYLADAIDMGVSTSDSFSYLATAQSLSGDNTAAEQTMGKAAVLYPRSVFVLVRLGTIQQMNGKADESAATIARAERLDQRASRTWQTMITEGFHIASSKQAADRLGLVPVMDLQPQTGVFAVLTERLIKHPEEQQFSLFRPLNSKRLRSGNESNTGIDLRKLR